MRGGGEPFLVWPLKRFSVVRKVVSAPADPLRQIISSAGTLGSILAISVLFYVIAIVTVYCASRAVGGTLAFWSISAAVPLVLLLSSLPLTVNGLGLSEAGYVFTLTILGATSAEALTIALLLRARILLTGVLGGLVFVSTGGNARPNPDELAGLGDEGTPSE